jgi:3D (Asp-Asp-Asp) domain-containing protein
MAAVMFPARVAPEPALRHTCREPSRADTAQVFICTAYAPTGHLTKTETVPQVGRTIAVDPKVIPLGSRVRVDGREYVAEDTGKLVRGRHIDIFMANEREARNFGVQLVEVEVESCESR